MRGAQCQPRFIQRAQCALRGFQDGLGSLGVLVTNVVGIVTAATLTLVGQRRLRRPR